MAKYKINSNKSLDLLYSKDKEAEKEIIEMTPFTIVTNNIKYLDVTLTKQVKDLYDRNFKTEERNPRRPQKMEISSILLYWQN